MKTPRLPIHSGGGVFAMNRVSCWPIMELDAIPCGNVSGAEPRGRENRIMDARERERLQASAIAAALNAMWNEADPDDEGTFDLDIDAVPEPLDEAVVLGTDGAVIEACRSLACNGIRPSTRKVRAYLKEMGGAAPDDGALDSIVKRWKADQWKSTEVRRAFQAYCQLDAEQRAALQERIAVEHAPEAPEDGDTATFEIVARLRDGSSLHEQATSKTHAWIRTHNLLDRLGAEAVEILLRRRSDDGEYSTIRRWANNE